MKSFYLALCILAFSSASFAQDRFAFLCGASHLVHSNKYRTEFFLVLDLGSVREEHSQKLLDVYLETNTNSLIPEGGLTEVVTLELTKLVQLGDKTWFDVKAADIHIANSTIISFQTMGLGVPDGNPKITLAFPEIDQVPLEDGVCIRRQDQDSLWKKP